MAEPGRIAIELDEHIGRGTRRRSDGRVDDRLRGEVAAAGAAGAVGEGDTKAPGILTTRARSWPVAPTGRISIAWITLRR
jgi:hypothetical protein